tara:strand:- start:3845 stop:4471 length:627 start_codon:yes stop_codon:yes gene_type:complete
MENRSKPILFSTQMVRAILQGRKTQTRRIIKYNKQIENPVVGFSTFTGNGMYSVRGIHPDGNYGASFFILPILAGDSLWVRETWATWQSLDQCKPSNLRSGVAVEFKAGGTSLISVESLVGRGKWRPSIFMPRHISRLELKVTLVRIERLQSISEADAKKEGVDSVDSFKALWYSINGKESWNQDPWVFVYDFEIVDPFNFLSKYRLS